jgi:hypothetical protein
MNDKNQQFRPTTDRLGHISNLLKSVAAIIAAAGSILATLYALDFFSRDKNNIEPQAQSVPVAAPIEPTNAEADLIELSPTPPLAQIYDVQFCDQPCEEIGAIRISSAREKTERIHIQWSYKNMPEGMRYSRTWSMDGKEWIRYDCIWQGSEEGTFNITLQEPMGLHSGTWVMTISTEATVLAEASIPVLGNYDYWAPAGFQNCPDFVE